MIKFSHLFAALFLFLATVHPCLAMESSPAEAPAFELPDRFFPILSWDLPHWSGASFSSADHGLASPRDCGFTTAAFVRPQHLAETEKLGLKCILAAKDFPIPWRKPSDEQIENTVKPLVDSAGNSLAVMGHFLADEPGAADFSALGKAVAAVNRLAPGKLAYVNLSPITRRWARQIFATWHRDLSRIPREIHQAGQAAIHQLRQLSNSILQ